MRCGNSAGKPTIPVQDQVLAKAENPCPRPYVEVPYFHHILRWTLSSCLPHGLGAPTQHSIQESRQREMNSQMNPLLVGASWASLELPQRFSMQSSPATIRYLLSLSEDQTHPWMSHCSNSISRSDKLSLEEDIPASKFRAHWL